MTDEELEKEYENYMSQFYNLTEDKINALDESFCHWKYKALINYIYELQQEKQQLVKFLKDKIKECMDKKEAFIEGLDNLGLEIDIMKVLNQRKVYQEVLDFVNKGGKDE